MASKYEDLIKQNCAPCGATKIGVYNSNNEKVGEIELPSSMIPNVGEKLYSFGAISDIHLQESTAQEDFQRALTYFNNEESVNFICIAGDLTSDGTDSEFTEYKNYVNAYSPNTNVYAITGNHDVRTYNNENIENIISTYTGNPLYYTFTQGDDLFIMLGIRTTNSDSLFSNEELQWLYETLEENRNKRCFIFEHVRPQDGCGNAFEIYDYDIWGGTEQIVFESLVSHYTNVILFHGHSHLKFYLQYGSDIANYDNIFGCHSVHIPSLAVPRDGDASGASSRREIYADSEGYVVDVYPNHVILKGRDFVSGKFLPIAIYCLDTTIKEIPERSFIDSTGTLDLPSPSPDANNVVWEIGGISSSSPYADKDSNADGRSSYVPYDENYQYTLSYGKANSEGAGVRLFFYDENKTALSCSSSQSYSQVVDINALVPDGTAYVRARGTFKDHIDAIENYASIDILNMYDGLPTGYTKLTASDFTLSSGSGATVVDDGNDIVFTFTQSDQQFTLNLNPSNTLIYVGGIESNPALSSPVNGGVGFLGSKDDKLYACSVRALGCLLDGTNIVFKNSSSFASGTVRLKDVGYKVIT